MRAERDAYKSEAASHLDGLAKVAAARDVLAAVYEKAQAWAAIRMEYDALSESVQQRFADAGRPSGYSAWTPDEQLRHTNLLAKMLAALKVLEEACATARAATDTAARAGRRPIVSAGERDREAAVAITGPCSCDVAYTGRGLVAPDCQYHDSAEDIAEAIATARAEGHRAGMLRAAEMCHEQSVEAAYRTERGECSREWLAVHHGATRTCAAAIRAAAREEHNG